MVGGWLEDGWRMMVGSMDKHCISTLQVNHHLQHGGSIWMMINYIYLKNGGS